MPTVALPAETLKVVAEEKKVGRVSQQLQRSVEGIRVALEGKGMLVQDALLGQGDGILLWRVDLSVLYSPDNGDVTGELGCSDEQVAIVTRRIRAVEAGVRQGRAFAG